MFVYQEVDLIYDWLADESPRSETEGRSLKQKEDYLWKSHARLFAAWALKSSTVIVKRESQQYRIRIFRRTRQAFMEECNGPKGGDDAAGSFPQRFPVINPVLVVTGGGGKRDRLQRQLTFWD
ncbi:hypothetical protein PGT21_026311 [Puccinia graminis f. sp. tritici]|uniref:Uncharacterized protein n=1 Tax=Puccinia graminis f. sp. tritici TaxID=56615 RepID=A0A5B0NVE7_PUCGR|nr:hypothetical protein PGT21_026311 [Puccinia graminis f. sp. tritici]